MHAVQGFAFSSIMRCHNSIFSFLSLHFAFPCLLIHKDIAEKDWITRKPVVTQGTFMLLQNHLHKKKRYRKASGMVTNILVIPHCGPFEQTIERKPFMFKNIHTHTHTLRDCREPQSIQHVQTVPFLLVTIKASVWVNSPAAFIVSLSSISFRQCCYIQAQEYC